MMSGSGQTEAVSLRSGVGRIRARTVALGGQAISVESIATIRIFRGQRSWWLLLLGLIVIAGAATQLVAYGPFAMAGIAFGAALGLADVFQRVDTGLSIGTSDCRITQVISRDQAFLQRLMQVLTDKMDTGGEHILADFDIERGSISMLGPEAVGADDYGAGSGSGRPQRPFAPLASPDAPLPAPHPQDPLEPAARAADSADEALFADTRTDGPAPPTAPVPPPVRPAVQAERRQSYDPLLDSAARPAPRETDWLASHRPTDPPPATAPDGAAGRVLLALLIVALLGGGVFAAWYLTGETGSAPISTLADSDSETPATAVPPTPRPMLEASAEQVSAPQEPLDASPIIPPVAEDAPAPAAELPAAPAGVLPAEMAPGSEIEDYTPPAPMVARASGQRYRVRPSTAEGVAVLAETRAGGEVLNITGRLVQTDGEWYRVVLPDTRTAWFKASLAVPRARFADSLSASVPRADSPFAASAPQIVDPAEAVQLMGGPQTVRLAWVHRADAVLFIVEIESYDATTQRWVEDPPHKRITVENATELSEAFPSAGDWRWRVRGVTSDGQQSQYSRWSAFTIRN